MQIDKLALHQKIEEQLALLLRNTAEAAIQAHETATHEENKAENKYDTLGLEAAYLAEGQSKRVEEFKGFLQAFKKLKVKHFNEEDEIGIGSLIYLNTGNNDAKHVFLSPVGGGIEFYFQDLKIMLITESSPLGKALKNNVVGDEVILGQNQHAIRYEIKNVC